MGIGGEDRLELRVGEGVHVVLDEHLEQALLADLADVVARAALTVEQQPEGHAGVVQDPGEPLGLALHALVERGEVSDEPDVLHRLLAGVGDREVESLGPASAPSRGLAVGVALHGEVLQRLLQQRIHVAPLDERAAHVDDRAHRLDPRGAAVDARHARRALPDALRTVDPREDVLGLARARLLERARRGDQRGRTDEAGRSATGQADTQIAHSMQSSRRTNGWPSSGRAAAGTSLTRMSGCSSGKRS